MTEPLKQSPNPYEASEVDDEFEISSSRGVRFACLYAFGSWIVIGIATALLMPAIFQGDQWNHEKLGALISQVSAVVISLPLGILGYFLHRRVRVKH